MARSELDKNWAGQRVKHRSATVGQWKINIVRTRTNERRAHSQYNPEIYSSDEAIRELEILCVDEGELIVDCDHKKTFYMKTETIVGACSGELTCYVFAEWKSREVHGRPISKAALAKMGVKL